MLPYFSILNIVGLSTFPSCSSFHPRIMPRRTTRRKGSNGASSGGNTEDEANNNGNDAQPPQRSVAVHVRERQRAVAEREAARLARPEKRPTKFLGHADRKKSAVTSTPSGYVHSKQPSGANNVEGWCGPFSVAREMIEKREAARREEEENDENRESHPLDEAMKELEQEKKRKMHPSIQWKSSASSTETADKGSPTKRQKLPSLYAIRMKRVANGFGAKKGISSLYNLCINFLVDNFEYVESLGFVDAAIRKRVAHELVGRNALDDTAFQALLEPGMDALEMCDASGVTPGAMVEALERLLPTGLRYLSLDQCGRCFGNKTTQLIVEKFPTTTLQALSIGGAYCLNDTEAAKLITTLQRNLQSIEFKACPRLKKDFCSAIAGAKELHLRELALEDLNFDQEAWDILTKDTSWAKGLESLRLKRMGLDDEKSKIILEGLSSLTALDLGLNHELTDMVLSHIRALSCPLSELRLTGLKELTSEGLEAFFTVVPDMGPPPRLRLLDLSQCHHESVTDEVVKLATETSSFMPSTQNEQMNLPPVALASSSPHFGLAHLNVSGSSLITDSSLEVLVATCGNTLVEVNLSFCTALTDQGLGYFVDNCGNQLKSIEVFGLAQISEVFLDGHRRIKDPSLQITGAWMKKNQILAIR